MSIRQVSKREFRELMSRLSRYVLPENFIKSKDIKSVSFRDKELFIVNQKPLFVKIGRIVIPYIENSWLLEQLPKIIVDTGAVPHLSNGADVMIPGIVSYQHFEKDDIVCVYVEKYDIPLAIGVALLSSEDLSGAKRGKAVRNLHYRGDEVWRYLKG
jgi:PUA domain protein